MNREQGTESASGAQAVRSRTVSSRMRGITRAIGSFFRRLLRSGRQRFTVMLIPHSEKRVFNLQLNTYALVFAFVLAVAIVGGFVYLATVFTGTDRLASEAGDRLEEAEASLEQVRLELGEFFQVWDDFESTLEGTVQRLDIDDADAGVVPVAGGDLASLLDLEQAPQGEMQELQELDRVIASLRTAMGPLGDIADVLDLHQQLLSDIPNFWPVINGRGVVTMEFGPNIHPIEGVWYMHKGIDIAYSAGTPIVAAANGVVTDSGFDSVSGYGGFVEIDHNYGFKTKYGHMRQFDVSPGDEVVQGQRIGTMGNTGTSTGSHLDFQIWIGTENIDPAYFLKLSTPDFNRRTRTR